MRLFAIGVVVCVLASVADAGSFRGGTVGWQIHDLGAPRTVELTITTFWDEPTSEDTSVDVDFGDGTTSGPLTSTAIYSGVTRAKGEAFTIRRATTTHTYAANGTYTTVIDGCCRHATANAAAADSYRIDATVARGTGSYGNPAMLMVDAQIDAGPTAFIDIYMHVAEATCRRLTNQVVGTIRAYDVGDRCTGLRSMIERVPDVVFVDELGVTKNCSRTCAIPGRVTCKVFKIVPPLAGSHLR